MNEWLSEMPSVLSQDPWFRGLIHYCKSELIIDQFTIARYYTQINRKHGADGKGWVEKVKKEIGDYEIVASVVRSAIAKTKAEEQPILSNTKLQNEKTLILSPVSNIEEHRWFLDLIDNCRDQRLINEFTISQYYTLINKKHKENGREWVARMKKEIGDYATVGCEVARLLGEQGVSVSFISEFSSDSVTVQTPNRRENTKKRGEPLGPMAEIYLQADDMENKQPQEATVTLTEMNKMLNDQREMMLKEFALMMETMKAQMAPQAPKAEPVREKIETMETEVIPSEARTKAEKLAATQAKVIGGAHTTPEGSKAIDPKMNQKYITIGVHNELDHFRKDRLVLKPVRSNGQLSGFKIKSTLHTADLPITSIRGDTTTLLKWANDGKSLYGLFTDFWSKSKILLSCDNDYNDMNKYISETSDIKGDTNLSSWLSGEGLREIEDDRRRAEDYKETNWDRD